MINIEKYCIFKGVNSLDLGLYMEFLPERISPRRRDEAIVISGRHGSLTATDGTFETYILQSEFILKNLSKTDEICSHFKGEGDLIFSDTLNRKFRARVSNKIEFSRIIRDLKRFVVEFEVQPFMYEAASSTLTLTEPTTILNIGNFESEPITTIYGQGDITLTINNSNIILNGVERKITPNSEALNAYNDSLLLNNKISGDFPVLSIGENIISWTGSVTKLEIMPNWRWL
nr:MAG TPA: distal tail protein [Caudoviricetes sp.]